MNNILKRSTVDNSTSAKGSLLSLVLISFGIVFLVIALGLAMVIAIAAYNFVSQPELFANLLDYAKTQENLIAKWVSSGDVNSIELSNIFSLLLIVIAITMVVKVIIGFISMCVSTGKGLLNLSRNFSD